MSIAHVGRWPRLEVVPTPGAQQRDAAEDRGEGIADRARVGVARMRVRLAQHIAAEPRLAPVVPMTAARSARRRGRLSIVADDTPRRAQEQHRHAWQITEIEYSDAGSVRRLACVCGAIDFQTDY